ncbi:hypothetical protein RJ641_017553 [Dillenia turbinata]|uniref:FAS1 domain-containing protein n=1 Tax=Dillenia turbinata TaxID=194707 RepID=A0AAN8UW63_9MAGN
MTVLAPTDNAFDNLKAGTLNSLATQQQVEHFSTMSCPNTIASQCFKQNQQCIISNFSVAVYQVDKVLLPEELFGNKTSTSSPPSPSTVASSLSNSSSKAASPTSSDNNNAASGGGILGWVWLSVLF